MLRTLGFAFLIALGLASRAPAQVELTQVVSREYAGFDCRAATLVVGRDGRVYLSNQQSPGFVLRCERDGGGKYGGIVVYAMGNATANAAGMIATANAHFAHAVNLYDSQFRALAANAEFLVNDTVGWDAPLGVEAGEASGDFFAVDQHRNRVVRVDRQGRTVTTYPIYADEKAKQRVFSFRVCEKTQSFYWGGPQNDVRCSDWTGNTRWTYRHPDGLGSFDVDAAGRVYVIGATHEQGVTLDDDGRPDGRFQLECGERRPVPGAHLTALRVFGGEVLIKRAHATELFQRFELATGKRLSVVEIDHERLTARYPSRVWTAGASQPLAIQFEAAGRSGAPRWRVWGATWGDVDWRELAWRDQQVEVPADLAGLVQIKVSPELRGAQTGSPSEYLLRDLVEVRAPGSRGVVSLFTSGNRVHFAHGEAIRATVIVRAPADSRPAAITATLTDGAQVVTTRNVAIDADGRGMFTIPAEVVRQCRPGRWRITAKVDGMTVAPQPLVIGLGRTSADEYRITVHGDYGLTSNYGNLWDSRDVLSAQLARTRNRRVNQFVDRFGIPMFRGQFEWSHHDAPELPEIVKRLEADPHGVAPEKARLSPPGLETQAAYGAAGVGQWSILTYMDAGLPLGAGHDRRTPAQYQADIKVVTEALQSFPSFRGWSWTSNWWIYEPNKIVADDKWKAYEAALKIANETGRWSPILDEVGEARWNLPPDSRRTFQEALRAAAPRLKQADSGPYRNVQVHPPITYRDVDETDVQFQAEQITVPNWYAHAADYEKRPGKPIWFHPEIWNDQGTGEQILPTLFQIAMRGGDGVGSSGWVPNWGRQPYDDRSGYHGSAAVMRAVGDLFQEHGPWLLKTKKHDRVAIVVSSRLVKIDNWRDFSGLYFSRIFEAYQSCLYAHRPASTVFVEDLGERGLKDFQAVLVVGQTVELEPPLAAALREARQSGVAIFADGSCRPELVGDFAPLGVAFDHLEKLHSINNDFAYWEHPRLLRNNAAVLREKLAPRVAAVADCPAPEVMLSERLATDFPDVRYVFAVNNTSTPVEPGSLWRMTLGIATRLPVRTTLALPEIKGRTIFDLFAERRIEPDAAGRIDCDLRTLPARVFAIVPDEQAAAFAAARRLSDSTNLASSQATQQELRVTEARRLPDSTNFASRFGPHVKSVAVAGDVALLNTFNWDVNLYALDVRDGRVRWSDRVGHYFAFSPQATGDGFAVQGYDFRSAHGYHLHLLDADGKRRGRFALPSLPQRLPHEFISGALLLDRENQFAVSPRGDWIAATGKLSFAAWDREGKLQWSEDRTKTGQADASPSTTWLRTLDDQTLVEARDLTVVARDPRTGSERWRHELARSGRITRLAASADGRTLALQTTTDSGRLFLVRDGRPAPSIPATGDELALSNDGSRVALVDGEKLKLYDTSDGLLWQFNGDERLHHPQFSPDGRRLACSSESGIAYVLSSDGQVLCERDLLAPAVPAWLPGGDLLLASWLGAVVRLDERYQERWRTTLASPGEVRDVVANPLPAEDGPTALPAKWSNAEPQDVVPPANLLAPNKTAFQLVRTNGQQVEFKHPVARLCDGDRASPETPWIDWREVYPVGSGDTQLTLVLDRFNANLRVTGVTLVEDPTHAESWLRDVRFEFWNPAAETWELAGRLLSDQATHTHLLARSVESARFRFVLPRGFVGNLRLGEILLHGEQLGPSHPDAVLNRDTVVLFDETESDLASLKYPQNGFSFRYDGAFQGGKCLAMEADKTANAYYRPPFGHLVPNWDFRIVERPTKPGEYRWLSFAWKSAPGARGVTLRVGEHHAGGVVVHAGEPTKFELVAAVKQVAATPPTEWSVVTVDLWQAAGRDFTVASMSLGTLGGAATFDRLLLGRAERDVTPRRE